MNTSDFLCRLPASRQGSTRRVNHLEHEYRSDVDATQAKQNELMLLQRARDAGGRAQAVCAADARTAVNGSRLRVERRCRAAYSQAPMATGSRGKQWTMSAF